MTMYTLKQKLGEICRYFIAAVINTGIINLFITRTTMAIAVRDGPPICGISWLNIKHT